MTQNRTESGLPSIIASERDLHTYSFSFDEAGRSQKWFNEENPDLERYFQKQYEDIEFGHGRVAANAYKAGIMQLYHLLSAHSKIQQQPESPSE